MITHDEERDVIAAVAAERARCLAIVREVLDAYPTDVFPEESQSPDARTAAGARLACRNIAADIRAGTVPETAITSLETVPDAAD